MVKTMLGRLLMAEQLTTIWGRDSEGQKGRISCAATPPPRLYQGRKGGAAYLAVGVLGGANGALDVGDGIGGARQQRGARVDDGLAAPAAGDGLSVHGDAEGDRQQGVALAPREHLSRRRSQVPPEAPPSPSISQ